ncbi:MAG TPA: carbamoyltransferase C-terminal domain-containing protein [Dongiaceae bacterium]|nr:carbamoyltransferase C-terminal domain-containing protein [Dongiaceae bacterium]
MKRNYIGLATTFHDSALAIVNAKGDVVFAEATERYLQNKSSINIVPDLLTRAQDLVTTYCDPDAQLVFAHTWSDQFKHQYQSSHQAIVQKGDDVRKQIGELPFYLHRQFEFIKAITDFLINSTEFAGRTLAFELGQLESRRQLPADITRKYDHHLTHAAAACFSSPHDEAVCVVLDGFGEHGASDVFTFKDGQLTSLLPKEDGDGSLGAFYKWLCRTCGLGVLSGEEWKVMGLAPYGKLDPTLYRMLRSTLKVEGLHIKTGNDLQVNRALSELYKRERKNNEPLLDYADLAFTGQTVFEEVLFEVLNNVYDLNLSRNLVLAGGCMLNSSANGKVLDNTRFDDLYVFSAPADDGNAIGAALLAYHEDNAYQKKKSGQIQLPYLGSSMSQKTLQHVRQFGRIAKHQTLPGQIHHKAAELLAEGKIIAWVQGRAEFGPRALGNRSILADPRSPAVKDRVNGEIKFREEFRPFAPSILHEFGSQYFEHYQESPYMERTLKFKADVLNKVPGVVHVDNTGRLQTVKREWNERYYDLIKAFYELTGVPLVLNTSFNVMGKPIVHSVEDALAVFFTSGLDALIIEDDIFEK